MSKNLALVRVQDSNIYLVLEASTYDKATLGDLTERERHEYDIEEHTCPIDLLARVKEVLLVESGHIECDPHGILELIEVVRVPDEWPSSQAPEECYIFPMLKKLIEGAQKEAGS